METDTKQFPLRTLLTVTTGRLLTKSSGPSDNGIDNLYELLGWMTNDSPFAHQLPRFADECKPWLLRWFPELKMSLSLKDLDKWLDRCAKNKCPEEGVKFWVSELQVMFPEIQNEYDVPRIPVDDHDRKDPYDELVEMRGSDEGIIVIDAGEGSPA